MNRNHGASSSVRAAGTLQITNHLETVLREGAMQDRHRKLARAVLSLLPPTCQDALETFSVQYGSPAHRGLAGNGVIIVSGEVPDAEFVGLLLHEGLGHFQDITCLTGNPRTGLSPYRDGEEPIYRNDPSAAFYALSWTDTATKKANAVEGDFVTGYAYEADCFEDLAESVTYYIAQLPAFEERARTNPVLQRKLDWLKVNYPGRGGVFVGTPWNGTVAWDATKLVQL
jgi:hypothetical protein